MVKRETRLRFIFHVGWWEVLDACPVNFATTINYGIDQYEYQY